MGRTFVSGQRVRKLPTRALNEAIEAARQAEVFGDRHSGVRRNSLHLVEVANRAGDDLDQWFAVGFDESSIDPADNEQGFRSGPIFDVVTPLHDDHLDNFALLASPLVDGQVGFAVRSGTVNCKVTVNNVEHRYVRPQDNADGLLETCGAGGGRILWPRPFTATGEQWATVLLEPFAMTGFAYLTASLTPPAPTGIPKTLTPTTATATIYDFDSNGDWSDMIDEITIHNPWEQVSGAANHLASFEMMGGKFLLTGLSCDPSGLF